jgi:hypothetical protein
MLVRAILPTLIIGTSSVALAHPTAYDRDRRYDRYERELRERREHERYEQLRERYIREQRAWRERWLRERAERWRPVVVTSPSYAYVPPTTELALSGATPLASRLDLDVCNRLAGRTAIHVEARGQGRTFIDEVELYYADRDVERIKIDRYLDAGDAPIQLGLGDGANVTRIVVEGRSEYGGAIAVDAT